MNELVLNESDIMTAEKLQIVGRANKNPKSYEAHKAVLDMMESAFKASGESEEWQTIKDTRAYLATLVK